jgi:hypothetical protein
MEDEEIQLKTDRDDAIYRINYKVTADSKLKSSLATSAMTVSAIQCAGARMRHI